ncbi:MAG: adenosylmethionine--8-amino-7-oxononanoate transaminase, partial [Desulfovibrio sp.]|nr:adenosylmethionine--8-amino-7-oxononanoate transaminase [Desulfovibrio sp.]
DKAASTPADIVLLEGAGGLLTPLSETETMADLFARLAWPVLLVVGNKLGAVNHALLSLSLMRARDLDCPGFLLTAATPGNDLEESIRADNGRIIEALSQTPCLAAIPHLDLRKGGAKTREAAMDSAAGALSPALDALRSSMMPAPTPGPVAPEDMLAYDRRHIWHPYTSALRPMRNRLAEAASGARIRLADGTELVDGMASWWCAIHGYGHPALMKALRDQARVMPHVMFGGLTHAPAVRLAHKLLAVAPACLEHVFFADSGSVAVEVAIKMALQYQQGRGAHNRKRILAVRGAYHGDTMGAMSVCDPVTGMHSLFSGSLPSQLFAPRPECRFDAPYDPACEAALASIMAEHAGEIAAVIVEPIVQGAGGMWFYHPQWLRRLGELCRETGCLLILDEIATGFGRTGLLFACEHAGVAPDILCLGKGLSGGVMTLAATLAGRAVAEGISQGGGVLMHGPTFMANPLACAVARASLDLLESGAWQNSVKRIEKGLTRGLAPCAVLPGVADVRVLGAIGVVEMRERVNVERLQDFFVRRGVWLRPFGKLIYAMPPYVMDDDELGLLTAAVSEAVEKGLWK